MNTGVVAREGSQMLLQDGAQATHTDGHAGGRGALLPGYKQVLHLHLPLQLWGWEASVVATRTCCPSPSQTPQSVPAHCPPGALTSALCHLDLQELLSVVGDGVRGPGHRAK